MDDWNRSWGNDNSNFATADNTWLKRGGRIGDGSNAGVFASNNNSGWNNVNIGSRAALAVRANIWLIKTHGSEHYLHVQTTITAIPMDDNNSPIDGVRLIVYSVGEDLAPS